MTYFCWIFIRKSLLGSYNDVYIVHPEEGVDDDEANTCY
jgi:hypothetical protein